MLYNILRRWDVQAAEANKHRELGDAAVKGMAAGTNFKTPELSDPPPVTPETYVAGTTGVPKVVTDAYSSSFSTPKTATRAATLTRESNVSQELFGKIREGNRVSDGSERLSQTN